MDTRRTLIFSAVLLATLTSAFVEELDDSFLTTRTVDDSWIIKFYAPWCSLCKQLDPVWHQIGSELKSLGSPVKVGKCDATANIGLAKEFRVKGYPAILMWKKHLKYNYSGPRTRDAILDFTHRVSGPVVRSLNSLQIFQHAISRHDIMFVYVGATSPLKGNFMSVAEELVVHTHFFSAARDVLPKDVSLSSLPTVLLFKDTTFHTYTEENDGDLRSWVNRERFPYFSKIDSFALYAMGESGKLVALVLLEERSLCEESERLKDLLRKVTSEQRHMYSRHFYFGFMTGNDYIKGLIMSDVIEPSFVVVNLSNDGYFLPHVPVKTERQLRDFLDGVVDGGVQCQGGNNVVQRIKRLIYEAKAMLTLLFTQVPLLSFFLLSFPLAIAAAFFYLCCKPHK
ncbi:disulfide-isomerase TMX3-like [Solea senegalensis]|uniref:protein disulfide-isomerase n=1 Tax=Solea senegalensis TaxID=28829 RepID=A0AAV6SZ88_SOLSE|nr:protein disulfide-isomerase TMX3-like [Solea senegalensis]KAG7522423.1 disulfide-isomerase TMX3-like [Solea senegalensis]